jgi:hypothetical protein
MAYNPYDLVPMKINGQSIYGRPTALDSVIVDHKNLKNAFGSYVKPIELSTTCPDCGQGFIVKVQFDSPPFSCDVECPLCRPPVAPLPEVFTNPVKSKCMRESDLDPSLLDLDKPNVETHTTVAERQEKSKKAQKKASKKAKKVKAKPKSEENTENIIPNMEQPDEDISLQDLLSEDSEVDEDANFDDGDMVDHE